MAKGTFTPSTVATDNITELPSVVVGQAITLQPLFDKGTLDTKTFINSTLIAELNGDDGANKIGCNPSNLASDNVKEALEELQTNIQNTSVGAIPDGSLTDAKLSNTAGQIKARVATAETEIDTLQADVNIIESDSNYSLATIVSRQIRITKSGALPTTNFKISAAITVGAQLTISLDAGATSLPLVDTTLAAITSIESGVHQVIFDTTRYILNPFGQVGGLASLSTTTKASLVAAINELFTNKADKVTPTRTTVTTGFLANWSGFIRYWKNQENLVSVFVELTRSADIISTLEVLYTMPAGYIPILDAHAVTINLLNSGGTSVATSFARVFVSASGAVCLLPVTSTTLTNARKVSGVLIQYYAA